MRWIFAFAAVALFVAAMLHALLSCPAYTRCERLR